MRNFLLPALGAAALLLNGCADTGLEPEVRDRGPAPYSPDPMQHIPDRYDPTQGLVGGSPRI